MTTAKLPVARMVLYKHGVGFVERRATVESGAPIRLAFKRAEMDDILKSLTVSDLGDGRVTGLSYETAEDVAVLLADRAITLPQGAALRGLAKQLTGYDVRITSAADTFTGCMVGVDEQPRFDPETQTRTTASRVMVRDDAGRVTVIDLDTVQTLEVRSSEAAEDLAFYLDTVTAARKHNEKHLTVFLDGAAHDIVVSYIMSLPAWRVSYRIALDDRTGNVGAGGAEDGAAAATVAIQGWGIIDNPFDEDLDQIQLQLVAGKPISFIYDIYTPRQVDRPHIREEARTVSAPVELDAKREELAQVRMSTEETRTDKAVLRRLKKKAKQKPEKKIARSRNAVVPAEKPARAPYGAVRGGLAGKSVSAQTRAVDLGEAFGYDIEAPVTVKRGQSAMVPILQCALDCQREHVYNPQKMAHNPVVTLRLPNTTGFVLERGPVVVFEDEAYVGEAILPYTGTEAECQIAYAVDLGVTGSEDYDRGSDLEVITIHDRYFRKHYRDWQSCEYQLQNRKRDPVRLVVEHPKSTVDYVLDEDVTPAPTEETEHYYRWSFTLDAKSSTKLVVREQRVRFVSEGIRTVGSETLVEYFEKEYISEADYETVGAIIDLQSSIAVLKREGRKLDRERKRLFTEQKRLRENLRSIGDSAREERLRVRFVKILDAQETRLAELRAKRKANDEQLAALEAEIEAQLVAIERAARAKRKE